MSFHPTKTCPKCDNPVKILKSGNQVSYKCVFCNTVYGKDMPQKKHRSKP